MLNQTRGQIGLTAYKDYIFGILFYKYLSEKATHWLESVLRGETWTSVYTQDSAKALEYMKRTWVTRFNQMIFCQLETSN